LERPKKFIGIICLAGNNHATGIRTVLAGHCGCGDGVCQF
jgi:hypothetical protein